MSTSTRDESSSEPFSTPSPNILLATDNHRAGESLRQALLMKGFPVQLAPGYHALELLWQQHRHQVVLLEVSAIDSVEAAVNAAMSIKRHDPGQFVGYLADPILRTSGLAGDAIFPRNLQLLPQALRSYLAQEA